MTIGTLLAERFIARSDVKAWQVDKGYQRDDSPITDADLETHLSGERHRVGPYEGAKGTYYLPAMGLGHYLIDPATQSCKLFAYDIDLADAGVLYGEPIDPRAVFSDGTDERRKDLLRQLKTMAFGLAHRTWNQSKGRLQVACAFSGNKGLHVYALDPVGDPMPASSARVIAHRVMNAFGFRPSEQAAKWAHEEWPNLQIEVFPKQDEVGPGDYGNLMRLPLGTHMKSARASCFIRLDDENTKLHRIDPIDVLQHNVLPWRDGFPMSEREWSDLETL